ncbi:hypothetical protein C5748_13125 [Phyllobacterium phragmitis]|uniref:XRE family transcriptional regulator n=1 Tax=Phyllobacterium phragmitis TaxID=2670329 RepID=A0A2S9IRI9_9HYPH|nr:hypothetical protein [Phyllobacterium phragmitis]PRD43141.1 hypothetical protein C5748_13125 [Phyllobacterium phragmitis]
MFPKKGKKLHRGPQRQGRDDEFRQAVAAALKNELGTTHQATKTVMRWTGASERTVKHWFAASHAPSGYHLVAIARHSDAVLMCFLLAAGRPQLSVGLRWNSVRPMLVELLNAIDTNGAL